MKMIFRKQYLGKMLPGLFVIVVCCGFFWKFVFKNQIPLPGDFIVGVYYPWLDYKWGYEAGVPVKNPITADVVSLIYPEQMLAVDMMKKGIWPLWNPYILAGTPLLANLQTAPFSPTIFFYFIFEKATAWGLQLMSAHILAGIFMYLLLRYWKLGKPASLMASIAFAFSGFNTIFSQWNGHTLTSAFIPLIFYFFIRWFDEKKVIWGLGLAISFAMQVLSGYPQTCLYTAIGLFVYWLVIFFMTTNRGRKEILVRSLKLLPFVFLSFLFSAVQLVPTIELWRLSQRGHEFIEESRAFLPYLKTIVFIVPDFFGNHSTGNYWGPQDYTSNTGYVGVIVFFLMLVSINLTKKNKNVLFLVLLSLVALFVSYKTPLSYLLWKWNVLGMKSSSAHRATILLNFSFCSLSAFGLHHLSKKKKINLRPVFLGLGIFFIYLSVVLLLFVFRPVNNWLGLEGGMVVNKYLVAIRNMVIPGAYLLMTLFIFLLARKGILKKKQINVLFLILMIFELYRFWNKYTPFTSRDFIYPKTKVLEYLQNQEKPYRVTGDKVIPVNIRTPYNLESLEGYETIHPLLVSRFVAVLNSNKIDATPMGRYVMVDNPASHLLDLVNTKYLLTLKYDDNNNPDPQGEIQQSFKKDKYSLVFEDKTVAIVNNNSSLPRAFMINDWEVIEDDDKLLSMMINKDFPFKNKVLLSWDPDVGFDKKVDDEDMVEYVDYNEQDSTLKVYTSNGGLLFVSDAYFPGWQAFVDNQQVDIIRANYAFRAIVVPKGSHLVRFSYKPDSFYRGLRLTQAGILILSIAFYYLIRREKHLK